MYQVSSKEKKGRRGFTLVEMLVVVLLVLVLGTIALLNLGPRKKVKEFALTVQRLVHTLDGVRNQAVNFEGGDKWYFVFIKKTCGGVGYPFKGIPGYKEGIAVFFKGPPTISDSLINDFFPLPDSVAFDSATTFPSSGPCPSSRHIYFTEITGKPNDSVPSLNLRFKVYLIADPSISSTISVSSVGLISYTTSSLWSF